jgi:molecular chaperone DnaK
MGAVVGIDLGTTNTVVAAIRDGRPVAVPDDAGSTLIPSIISFLPSGAVLVGNTARERRAQDPRNTIYSVKRLIGRTWDSAEVQKAVTRFPFELREGPGRATFVIARGETYTLPEISAFVLRKAKSLAELELGESVDRAVITVPASFNDLQRAATKVAGRVAGLEVLRILNEPTAAALAFGHQHGNRERIAVYDLGGGTFDFTLLQLTDDVFEVLATAGDTFLGGDDIDGAIADRIAASAGMTSPLSPKQQPELLERLRDVAERIKLDLSESESAHTRLDDIELAGKFGREFTLSRTELDGMMAPLVDRTFEVCKDALTAAKLSPKDIDHVLLVGGTTRAPFVRQRVERYFGKRARAELDPHEVVAIGAAQQAMALTQVRATASGIPVPPPQRGAPEAPSALGRVADLAPDLSRKSTDSGVGGGETIEPGRVSVAPPEPPPTHPVPHTKKLGSRDRSTTGIGLGPQPSELVPPKRDVLQTTEPPSTLNGLGPNRETVDLPLVVPTTSAGANKTRAVSADADPGSRADALTRATAASKITRPDLSGAKSTIAGNAGAREQPKTTSTAHPTLPDVSTRATLPDDANAWPGIDDEGEIGLPIVTSSKRAALDRSVTTKVSAEAPSAPKSSLDLLADLPLVVARDSSADRASKSKDLPQFAGATKQSPAATAKLHQPTLSDLRPPFPTDETEDEPTVVRRSLESAADLYSDAGVDAPLDDLPAIANNSARESRPDEQPELPAVFGGASEAAPRRQESGSDMDEHEIRARYGNLPLIVGGRRVGARDIPNATPNRPGLDTSKSVEVGTNNTTELGAIGQAPSALPPLTPAANGGAARRDPAPLAIAPLASIPALDPLDLQPEDLQEERPEPTPNVARRNETHRQPERLEPADNLEEGTVRILRTPPKAAALPLAPSELDWSIADEAPPKSQRPASSRPLAKQQPIDELALPVPDLPPAPVDAKLQYKPGRVGVVQEPKPLQERPVPAKIPAIQAPPNPLRDREPQMAQTLAAAATIPLGVASPLATGPWQPQPVVAPATPDPVHQTKTEIPSLLASIPRLTASRPALLIDVTPLSLCVETVGGYVDVLIARNTPVPCERTRDFVTAQDNQQTVVVRVAQGESKQFQDNVLLGEVHLSGLPAALRSQSRIAVTFGIDSDGILHVRALDVASGLSALADLRLSGAPSSPEVAQMVARHSARHPV